MVAWSSSLVASVTFRNRVRGQRGLAVGDLLRPRDLRVDRLVVALAALERPLVDDPPVSLVLTGAHLPGRFEDLQVGEVVPVPGEVVGQVVVGLGDPGPDDEGEPGVLDRVQVAR